MLLTSRVIGMIISHLLNLPTIVVIIQVSPLHPLMPFMEGDLRSPIGWFQVGEFSLICPKSIYGVLEKV